MGEARRRQRKQVEQFNPPIADGPNIAASELHMTMEAAWEELSRHFFADLPRKQRQDAKFIFYNGVRAAANLMIYSAGAGGGKSFEWAADQITKEFLAYQDEAEGVLQERQRLAEEPSAGTG